MGTQQSQRHTAAPKAKRHAGCIFAGLCVLAGALYFGVSAATYRAPAVPTPFQACVTSIGQEGAGQVLGYTPQCMRLSVSDRMTAISQAG